MKICHDCIAKTADKLQPLFLLSHRVKQCIQGFYKHIDGCAGIDDCAKCTVPIIAELDRLSGEYEIFNKRLYEIKREIDNAIMTRTEHGKLVYYPDPEDTL